MTVCCDLTKLHEKTLYGSPESVLRALKENEKTEKGEYCAVLELPEILPEDVHPKELAMTAEARMIEIMKEGHSLREAQEILISSGEKKNAAKQAALTLKKLFKDE
jgi:16S rRNA (cytidine1402-2'-O)-methyltransferase